MPSDTNSQVSVGCPPASFFWGRSEEWKDLQFHFHDFASLSYAQDDFVVSPTFICNGHQWQLRLYPGGVYPSSEGFLSVELELISEGHVNTSFQLRLFDKVAQTRALHNQKEVNFGASSSFYRWYDIFYRTNILQDQNMLQGDGALTIIISMKEEPDTIFVPRNPLVRMMKDLFNDEVTADVRFEVDYQSDEKVEEEEGEEEKLKSPVLFHAHRLILRQCAPMLADLLEDDDCATISNVKPNIFRHLLYNVYGGRVSFDYLEANAKEFIDAADKYAIVNLKLDAEAAYVGSADITFDNAIDNLLYADSKNCAVLKEIVMDFLAANPIKAYEMISSLDNEFLVHVMKDLLIAFGRRKKHVYSESNADDLRLLSVSTLRRRLHKLGLEVDGSREAMIESIKKSGSTSIKENSSSSS